MDTNDIEIFKKLLETPDKSFLQISKEIGIAPITVQKKYEKLKNKGILKSPIVIDASKIGYELKAFFMIKCLPENDQDLIFESIKQSSRIFLCVQTIGIYDIIALGYFRNLKELREEAEKIRDQIGVESVEVNITDETDLPFLRDYNPLQIFSLENTHNLIKANKKLAP